MTLIRMLAFRPAAVANTDAGDVGGTINNVKKNEAGKDKTRKNEIGENDSIQAEQSIRTDENTGTKTRDISQANVASDTTNWQSIIDEMALVGLVKELAGHCALKGHSEGKVHLVLSPDKEHLLNQTQKERLSNALELRFGKGTQLKISIEEPEAETPAQKKAREEREKQKTAESSIKGDANVQAMEEIFGATLDEKSIRPV